MKKTENIINITSNTEILIVSCGVPELVNNKWIKILNMKITEKQIRLLSGITMLMGAILLVPDILSKDL